MADDYTPTTDMVREDFGRSLLWPAAQSPDRTAAFDRWLAAHDAEKRAEWEAEQGEAMSGEIRELAFEDGKPRDVFCGLEDCECPEHDDPPRRRAGTYITIRLDGSPRIGLWRVAVTRLPVTNTESEGKA